MKRWSKVVRVAVAVRDITADAGFHEFTERIPVVLVDGRAVLEGRWTSWAAARAMWTARRAVSRGAAA